MHATVGLVEEVFVHVRGSIARGAVALTLAAAVVMALSVAGCGSSENADSGVRVDRVAPESLSPVAPMSRDEKRDALPAGFPLEIPVPRGRVLSAESASGPPAGVFWYEIEIDASPEEALAWYQAAYLGASWSGVGSVMTGDVLTGLSFAKGRLGSMVYVDSDDAGHAIVRVDFGDREFVERRTF